MSHNISYSTEKGQDAARLSQAIKKKDFKEMNIAQGLLDVAKSNLDKISTAMSKCIDERNEIGKKRMRMIDSFSR